MLNGSRLVAIGRWLRQRAENISALLLAAMFVFFLIQIVTRYVFNYPFGWTDEASVLCWVWGTLWGAAFVLRERDAVRFDIIYSAVGERARRVFAVITGGAMVALFSLSLPAVYGYVTFLKVERTAYLGIRLDLAYSIYVPFAVAVIVRYAVLTWRAVRGETADVSAGDGSSL